MTLATQWLAGLQPSVQALLAGLLTLSVTAAGAALVVLGRLGPGALFEAMLGFASGIMLAAAFWSLLDPAIAIAGARGEIAWVAPSIGLLAGAAFLAVADRLLPHLHPDRPLAQAEGPRTRWSTARLLVLAITLHNIPEGLAVGVAFGAAGVAMAAIPGVTSLGAAVGLTIGIALQNFPEGAAVALPLRAAGAGRWRSFLAGTASAAVEPLAAVVGATVVGRVSHALPYALAFAAGAMIYVVIEELIPGAHQSGRADLVTVCALGGFTLMMILDVAFA
jgi:ZIP family zinc transporter